MSDRFFLDTSIFVYSFDRSAPLKAKKAEQLIGKALTTHKGVVSYQVVQEFFNVVSSGSRFPCRRLRRSNFSAQSSSRY